MNTILNIVPQGEIHVVERLGKMHNVEQSGWFIAIPFIDQIAYVIDMRERSIEIPSQSAITRDNVSVDVSGNVYIQFKDPQRACYGARSPLYAVRINAQSAMRAAIGEMELDEILHNRATINAVVKGSVQEAAEAWGIEVKRYEITEVTPDRHISEAMDKQAAAERNRREKVLEAEGEKQKATLESEGMKIKLQNESEGMRIQVENEAEAERTKLLLEAQGHSEAIILKAKAQAEAIKLVAEQLKQAGGEDAAKLKLAGDYAEMYGEMGKSSNTMLFQQNPGDVNALLAQAAAAFEAGKLPSK
eukprot:CAMPEP_0118649870 /NCGR_PEP_ID=MMETSP0785-20121206/9936_1 /TAXON_ID=91992 /ORGANISM="Bolidomonas pacifica, Strain CCMP 1866" /LENGTH=302 /DNA_ID=CAMNT_0006542191 /DNA_START=113 /DNA_END=1021 /DNA_ORIENTATION=-